ncbi:HemK2/MTQ2 family protein methyltransferase [Acidianus ambivalens]|uniref:Methyltransferase n=1 Tax=Acidianus ambivalens TaxID=2283 RepID=A0A650CXQ3_ACIAM|nr:HemK2/MTQ2 family protein methyltransferase [Acidianus ambivalens]MQL54814.1 methyltransferase [Acidianus ambivalens]QGR22603.1 methyltransferase [Acidianus ambivalens]
MSSYRTIEFNGIKLCINDEVYEPAEDTEFLLSIVKIKKGEKVIEIGSGSGILSIISAKMGGKVYSIDINPFASLATLCSSKLNNLDIDVINCDMLTCLRNITFDVGIFNPPYLPFEEYDDWIKYSWSGGKSGSEVLVDFINTISARRLYILYSSLSNEDKILEAIRKRKMVINRKIEKTFGFERLIALELNAEGSIS